MELSGHLRQRMESGRNGKTEERQEKKYTTQLRKTAK